MKTQLATRSNHLWPAAPHLCALFTLLLGGTATTSAQPVITFQPSSCTNVPGTSATFQVQATGAEPLACQWQQAFDGDNFLDRPEGTNTTLVIPRVQPADGGLYRAILNNPEGAVTSAVVRLTIVLPPTISAAGPPTNFPTPSLGGSIGNRVVVGGTAPFSYQWRFNGEALPGQTRSSILLTNLQAADEGTYDVLVTNLAGSITSTGRVLVLDRTFTKINTGPVVTDLGVGSAAASADYDGDGFADLCVVSFDGQAGHATVYHNNGDGTFAMAARSPFAAADISVTAAWADLDNDGQTDLVVSRQNKPAIIYFSNKDGNFSPIEVPAGSPNNIVVFDYDRDGLLDLLFAGNSPWTPAVSWLYHNNGDRTFTRLTSAKVGPLLSFLTTAAFTGDYNDDGWVDLFAVNFAGATKLFTNDRAHFLAATNGVFPGKLGIGAAGDYDNDGQLDVCMPDYGGNATYIYRNFGNGNLQRASVGQDMRGYHMTASWADYDNDGFLDLLLPSVGGMNAPYHNNGDGTFTPILTGSIVTEQAGNGVNRTGCAAGLWFDYDNDGFLDLYLLTFQDAASPAATCNFLYHNNGNTNAWLKLKLVGTLSNRDAVGAKVRLRARYAGQVRWQRRDITGGDVCNGSQLYAHFGLGDATNVDLVRIEWPSGAVQEFVNVAPRQSLTIWEPPALHAARLTDGKCQLIVTAEPNRAWQIQHSPDLVNWSPVSTFTNAEAKFQFTPSTAAEKPCRFYRVRSQ